MWAYAAEHGLTVVSKDSDLYQRSLVDGPPPIFCYEATPADAAGHRTRDLVQ